MSRKSTSLRTPTRRRTALLALATATVAGAVAAVALANVVVYRNDFSTRAEVRELTKSGGKKCKRKQVGKRKNSALKVTVTRGPATCSFRPPVAGDRAAPDHDVRAFAKITKASAKAVRRSAFLSLEVRLGGGGGYELRVVPKSKRFHLTRRPNGDGFPVRGRSDAVNRIGKRNKLRLVAFGARVRAYVNGRRVAAVSDPNPDQVSGTRLRFGIGHERRTGKNLIARFARVSIAVPDP